MIEASCHCGAVRLTMPAPTQSLTSCNCSICRRLGALWAYYGAEDVTLISGSDALVSYSWQDRAIEFQHCGFCGCTTHYTTPGTASGRRTAVNARMVSPDHIADLPVRHFDGAVSWQFVDDE